METFVSDLTRLYRIAADVGVDEFPERAVAQLRQWINFDGAVFGFGESVSDAVSIGNASVYNRDARILLDYAQISQVDPVTRMFVEHPGKLLNVDTRAFYGASELGEFSQQHDLRHLLLLGEESTDHSRLRWIVLYRGTKKAFDAIEANRLNTAWSHVLCALDLNRSRALDRLSVPGPRALALVNLSGAFEMADGAFLDILRREWHDLAESRLPAAAAQAMQNGIDYLGREVEIRFSHRGNHVVCQAASRSLQARLSPREQQVAEYFSRGMSYKEIAALLGSAPNTVRTQLANVYQKLGINDKAQLADSLARHGANERPVA